MRIVIKIGTSTLAHPSGHLNIRLVEELCKIISDIQNAGHQVILVSSGAIGMGVGKLGLRQRPTDIPTKQAAAAVGQCELMYTYDKLFGEYNHTVAQLLITREDIANEVRHFNFSMGAILHSPSSSTSNTSCALPYAHTDIAKSVSSRKVKESSVTGATEELGSTVSMTCVFCKIPSSV